MFSLQKALGKDDRFFNLLEASATEARTSAQALTKFFQTPGNERSLDAFAQSRRKEKEINAEIVESLAMGTPVVSTTVGAQGLNLQHGHDVLRADRDECREV